VAQGAKMCGARKIVGVDLNPAKQELGKSYFIILLLPATSQGQSFWLIQD
jgi:S-(hydroxymethyl)glutathione dehydrogenase/alcohol dehydrogenase